MNEGSLFRDIAKGSLGFGSSVFGVGITFVQIDNWLRVACSVVGLVVGVLSAISIARTLMNGKGK